jgi:hypothetical protein
MLASLALLGLPEWKMLSRVQRRFVWQHFIQPILTRWHMMIAKACLVALAVFLASLLGAFNSTSGTLIVMFLAVFVLTDLVDLLLLTRHRQQVASYIHSHGAEIQTAA